MVEEVVERGRGARGESGGGLFWKMGAEAAPAPCGGARRRAGRKAAGQWAMKS